MSARLRAALIGQSDFLHEIVQSNLQWLLEEEIELRLNADLRECTGGRRRHRNSYHGRQLKPRGNAVPPCSYGSGGHRQDGLVRLVPAQ